MVAKAKATGHSQVDRPHMGEGSVDTETGKPFSTDKDRVLHDDVPAHYQRSRDNLEMLLKAAEQLRDEGIWDPTKVITRYGHATHATPQQVARMQALGIIAEVNLGSNVVTGSLSQTQGAHGPRATEPRYQDHSLASLIYYDAQIVLSTDGPGVMATTLATEYMRAGQIIEAVLAGEQPIRVAVSDATVEGRIRGTEVPGQPDQRSLLVDELTSTERARFLHAYEKLFADAERYYLRRPKPGARVAGAPLDGAHHTTIAREGGLSSMVGEAAFAGTRRQVLDAAAVYRRAGYQVVGDNVNAAEKLVVVVTSPHSNEFTTTLTESDNSQQPSYTRGDRR
jgi:hypothetical protein